MLKFLGFFPSKLSIVTLQSLEGEMHRHMNNNTTDLIEKELQTTMSLYKRTSISLCPVSKSIKESLNRSAPASKLVVLFGFCLENVVSKQSEGAPTLGACGIFQISLSNWNLPTVGCAELNVVESY